MEDYKLTEEEQALGFDSFDTTIQSCLAGKVDYSNYCFFLSEDGQLYFLKKDLENRDEELKGEEHWPCNEYDGIELWYVETGYNRGTDIVTMFLQALKIKYQG